MESVGGGPIPPGQPYTYQHAQLTTGGVVKLPTPRPAGVPTLSVRKQDTPLDRRATAVPVSSALPTSRNLEQSRINDALVQEQQMPLLNLPLFQRTRPLQHSREVPRHKQNNLVSSMSHPPLIVINPGHVSNTVSNGSVPRGQMSLTGYDFLSEQYKDGVHSPVQNVLFRGPSSHRSGAFHVPRPNHPRGSDQKSTGPPIEHRHRPEQACAPQTLVSDVLTNRDKATSFKHIEYHRMSFDEADQRRQKYNHERLIQQKYYHPKLLHEPDLQEKQYDRQRSLHHKSEHQRLLQIQEQQNKQYEYQRSLQQKYDHRRLLQDKKQPDSQTSLQDQEHIKKQHHHKKMLQQKNGRQRSLQDQEHTKTQPDHQTILQHKSEQQTFRDLEQEEGQPEYPRVLKDKSILNMIVNHSQATSPFDTVNNSRLQPHNSNTTHHHQQQQSHHSAQHFTQMQQQQQQHHQQQQQHHHENFPTTSSHLLLRPSPLSPTSSASGACSHVTTQTQSQHIIIPKILVSSPPPQTDNRHDTVITESSSLSPTLPEAGSLKSRTLKPPTLRVPPVRTKHTSTRPVPPPRPVHLSGSNPPAYQYPLVDFKPIDNPLKPLLSVDTTLDNTPPLPPGPPIRSPPCRVSSTLQLCPSLPYAASPENGTPPLMISPKPQKPQSYYRDTNNKSPLETAVYTGLDLSSSHPNSVPKGERTPPSRLLTPISIVLDKLAVDGRICHAPPPPVQTSSLHRPQPSPDLLTAPQEKVTLVLTSSIQVPQKALSFSHRKDVSGQEEVVEILDGAIQTSSSIHFPLNRHSDVNLAPSHDRVYPPLLPARVSSSLQTSSSSSDLENLLSSPLTSVTSSSSSAAAAPSHRDTIMPRPGLHSIEDSNSTSPRLTPPAPEFTSDRPGRVARVNQATVLATVQDLSSVKLRTVGAMKTTLPPSSSVDDFDELPPPPPPHELILRPEDLAILAADNLLTHKHRSFPACRLPKPEAHAPAERSRAHSMSNMDFEVPDDIDLSLCPGLVEINKSTPNWKRDMIEKKNQEKIEEYVKRILKEREQEAKWKNVPEWKKKILQKKEEEEAAGSKPTPEAKTTETKKAEVKTDTKKPVKKPPPPPPPKDNKEDFAALKPKGDIVPAALSIDPEELAAMPPWKRELLFKRDKVPVTFSNEFNPDDDSPTDKDTTTS